VPSCLRERNPTPDRTENSDRDRVAALAAAMYIGLAEGGPALDDRSINPYASSQCAEPARTRRFPWRSSAFFVLAVCCMLASVIVVGRMHGLPFPPSARIALLSIRLLAMPILSAVILAAVLRVVTLRPTFRHWFYFSLMISCLVLGGFILASAAFGLFRELGMVAVEHFGRYSAQQSVAPARRQADLRN
jgi:hypothetical protein